MTYKAFVETRIGCLEIVEKEQFLTHLLFSDKKSPTNTIEQWTPLLQIVAKQLKEYLEGKRRVFDIPLKLSGTDFQLSVWNALLTIPYGKTRSYREIAEQVGSPKAYRAVGMANHRNPIAIIVPCHRVIGADGSLTGFGGGLELKRELLELERRTK